MVTVMEEGRAAGPGDMREVGPQATQGAGAAGQTKGFSEVLGVCSPEVMEEEGWTVKGTGMREG